MFFFLFPRWDFAWNTTQFPRFLGETARLKDFFSPKILSLWKVAKIFKRFSALLMSFWCFPAAGLGGPLTGWRSAWGLPADPLPHEKRHETLENLEDEQEQEPKARTLQTKFKILWYVSLGINLEVGHSVPGQCLVFSPWILVGYAQGAERVGLGSLTLRRPQSDFSLKENWRLSWAFSKEATKIIHFFFCLDPFPSEGHTFRDFGCFFLWNAVLQGLLASFSGWSTFRACGSIALGGH